MPKRKLLLKNRNFSFTEVLWVPVEVEISPCNSNESFDIVNIVTCQMAGKSKHACQPKAKRKDDSSRRFSESCAGHKRVDSDSAFARPPQIQLCITRMSLYKRIDPGRTRTCNLWFRNPTPYPLGHRADEISSTAHERSLQEIM